MPRLKAFGHVRDVVTGEAIEGASLRTTGFDWNFDEAVTTNRFGRFHMWVPSGIWQVNISATGYIPVLVDVEASREAGVETDLVLTPSV